MLKTIYFCLAILTFALPALGQQTSTLRFTPSASPIQHWTNSQVIVAWFFEDITRQGTRRSVRQKSPEIASGRAVLAEKTHAHISTAEV
jgi:hypothetical protein